MVRLRNWVRVLALSTFCVAPTLAAGADGASDGPVEAYGGPRSRWGAPLARACRAAVRARGADPGPAWSVRHEEATRR